MIVEIGLAIVNILGGFLIGFFYHGVFVPQHRVHS